MRAFDMTTCLQAQEKLKTNQTFIFLGKALSKYSFVAEVRSCHESKLRSTSTLYMRLLSLRQGISEIHVTVPFLDVVLHVTTMFRILGVTERWVLRGAVALLLGLWLLWEGEVVFLLKFQEGN